MSQEVPAIALEDVEAGVGGHVLEREGPAEGVEDGGDEVFGGVGEEEVFVREQVESFGAEGGGEDGGFAGEGFEDFQAGPAADAQGD